MKQPDPEHQIHSDGYKANTEAMHIDCDTTVRHYADRVTTRQQYGRLLTQTWQIHIAA